MSPIEQAVEFCGGQKKLADAIDVSPSFVHQLVKRERPIPAALCRKIEKACERHVTVHDLRPDVFGESEAA